MLRKLGRSITIVNAIAFLVVILIGGISIFLTKDILHNAYKIQELSRDIVEVDSMHSDAYRLVLAMHHFLIEEDELYSQESIEVINQLREKVTDYREDEVKELGEGKNLEIAFLDTILKDIDGLNGVIDIMEEFSRTGKFDRESLISLEEFAYEIESATGKINKIHLDKISRYINESLSNMWFILFIYLVFVTIGGVAIYAGHHVLLKKVVNPIKNLAAATLEFAGGTLNKRVHIDSETEVGQLYQSFNEMAEKLEQNDAILRGFNEELEKKVKERTAELEKANLQLQKTQNALIRSEKIAAVGQIAAGVTHEVKNPLNSLSINTQMLLRDLSEKVGPDSSAHETATLIKYEINRINNILEEFVKFAKFPEPQFYENDINQVVSEVCDLMSACARDGKVEMVLNLQEGIPKFRFDARQFKEVLMNLAQNGVRAMEKGGRLEIRTAMTDDENIRITVSDTGEGIPEKNMAKIFSPFFSTKEGGLGLGLSIVQRIVESHGGKITCSSTAGEGTMFEILVPLERG